MKVVRLQLHFCQNYHKNNILLNFKIKRYFNDQIATEAKTFNGNTQSKLITPINRDDKPRLTTTIFIANF